MRESRNVFTALIVSVLVVALGTFGMASASDDVVFASFYDQTNRVCLSDGIGGFTCRDVSADANDTWAVALGLIDGDPFLDVVLANLDQVNRVCFGDGFGGFIDCADVSADINVSNGVALGLIDGDQNLDAIFAEQSERNRVCLGDGLGGFTCSDVSADTNRSNGVALGFVNGDVNLDLVVANGSGQANRLCLGDGSGGFTCSDLSPADPSSTSAWASLGLIDGDAHLDVVFSNFSNRNRVCFGDGMGGFTCSDISTDTDTSLGNALGIFDDDEHLDVVFASTGPVGGAGEVNRVCFGDGLGGFACSDVSSEENASFGVAAGDLDFLIFADGFESGDTSAWSSTFP